MVKGEYLLWYDGDPERALEEKVKLAAARYRKKHGERPNVCYVHPSAAKGATLVDDIFVQPLSTVLKGHFMIGRENDPTRRSTRPEKETEQRAV